MFKLTRKKLFAPSNQWVVTHPKIRAAGENRLSRVLNAIARRNAAVWDYLPEDIRKSDGVYLVRYNGTLLTDEQLHTVRPAVGDVLEVTRIPEDFGVLESIILNIIIAAVLTTTYLVLDNNYWKPQEERAKKAGHLGPSYLFERFANTTRDGTPIPLVYGEHRIGGQVIQMFSGDEGGVFSGEQGYDTMYGLLGLCEGPICSISAPEFDGVGFADIIGSSYEIQNMYSDGGETYDFSGSGIGTAFYTRWGTRTQDIIPRLGQNGITANAYNSSLLSGVPVTLSGTTDANAVRIKIQFTPYGLWYQDGDGYAHHSLFQFMYRYRVDGGAWGSWTCQNIDRRRKDPFSYWVFIQYAATLQGVIDVQIQRNSADSDPTNGKFCAAVVKEYQEVSYSDIAYISTALFGYMAVARDKLNNEMPTASVLAQGLMPQEFLTGVRFRSPKLQVTGGAYAASYRTYTVNAASLPFISGQRVSVESTTDYPGAAHAWAFQAIACDRVTATTFRVAGTDPVDAWPGGYVKWPSKNPATIIMDLFYNRRMGLGNFIDRRIAFAVTGASGSFTVGELVTDPYGFRGVVKECSGTPPSLDLVVEMDTQFPIYGETLTGVTSGETATIGDISELYALDIASFFSFFLYCYEWVDTGLNYSENVGADSAAGGTTLTVTWSPWSTGLYTLQVGDHILVGEGTAREEHLCVQNVALGVLTTETVLLYTHTALQADEVHVVERRAECDIIFDGAMPAWEAICRIAQNALGVVWKFGSKFFASRLQDEVAAGTTIPLISDGNSKRGSFQVHYPPTGDRPNVVRARFREAANNWAEGCASVQDDLAASQDYGIIPYEADIYGVTRRSEARRLAIRRLKELRYASAQAEWEMDVDAIEFEPYDVVRRQADMAGWGTQGGRVVAATNDTVTLDKPVTLGAGTYYIRIAHPDGTAEEYEQITSAAGEHRTVSIAPSTWGLNPSGSSVNPDKPELYAIGTTPAFQCRVVDISLTEDFKAKIVAVRDNASIYTGDPADIPDYEVTDLPDPRALPPDVTDVTLSEQAGSGKDGKLHNPVDVSFVKPSSSVYNRAEIYWREGLGYRDVYGRKLLTGESVGNDTFLYPEGICTDDTYVYVCDTLNHRIMKLNYVDLSYVGTFGSYGPGADQFKCPRSICTDGTYLYIVDADNCRLVKMDVGLLGSVGGTWVTLGAMGVGANQFQYPTGICGDGTYVYVTDTGNSRVVKIDNGLLGSGAGAWATVGVAGSGNGEFNTPCGITTDGAHIWVCDALNFRLQQFDVALAYVAKIGSQGTGTDQFCSPRAIYVYGNYLYMMDCGYDGVIPKMQARLMARNKSDMSEATVLPEDLSEFGGYCGTGLDEFWQPSQIYLDSTGEYMFIADRWNNRIMRRRTEDDTGWTFAGQTPLENFRIDEPLQKGSWYTIAVVAVGPMGAKKDVSAAPSARILIGSGGMTPRDPVALYVRAISQTQFALYWERTTDPNTAMWEVRRGTDWETGTIEASDTKELQVIVTPPQGASETWWIKARNGAGAYSTNAVSATINLGAATATYSSSTSGYGVNARTG